MSAFKAAAIEDLSNIPSDAACEGTAAELLRLAVDHALRYLTELPGRNIHPRASYVDLKAAFGGPLPERPTQASDALNELVQAAEPGLLASTHPRFFGFTTGGAYPVAMAADLLTSTWDQCAAIYVGSPSASVAEEVCGQWLLELFGLPRQCTVGMTSGTQAAHITALTIARDHVLRQRGWDVVQQGLLGAPDIRVIVSRTSHATVLRALRILGLSGHITEIGCHPDGRIDVRELTAVIHATSSPLIVCLQVGNVYTGAADALREPCLAAQAKGAWVHVDGAFGLWAAASPKLKHLVEGLELADSWVTDAHKWLNVPYDSGILFCAHPDAHHASMTVSADYLTTGPEGSRDPDEWVPEMSRRARAFVMWAVLKNLGRSGLAELVERSCERASQFAARLAVEPGIEILHKVTLNQVLVRFRDPTGLDDDAHTRAVVQRFQEAGMSWVSPTCWCGKAVVRLSVCHWATSSQDIDLSANSLIECHRRPTLE